VINADSNPLARIAPVCASYPQQSDANNEPEQHDLSPSENESGKGENIALENIIKVEYEKEYEVKDIKHQQ